MLFDFGLWELTHDGDPRAFAIYKRHYSFYQYADGRRDDESYRNRNLFVGPGEKLVLIREGALFAWRKFLDDSGQQGVNCAVFRNESPVRASVLILAAEEWAAKKWPGERFYTYVNPKKVKGTCPGYCFRRARWKHCGETKGGLLIFCKKRSAP
jgi:hypothetical protein